MILLSFRFFGDCEHNILIAEVIQQRDLQRDTDLGKVRIDAEVRQQTDHHLAEREGHHVPHHKARTLPPDTAPIVPICFEKHCLYVHRGAVGGFSPSKYNIFRNITDWKINNA